MISMNTRYYLLTISLIAVLVFILLASIASGPANIDLIKTIHFFKDAVAQALQLTSATEQTPWEQIVIWEVRLPRTLTAMFVGAALAVSGCVLQGLFRNPLASSGTLGVSAGASLGAVFALYMGLTALTVWALPLFAFMGAAFSLLLVVGIAGHRGQIPTASLLLAGIAVGALNIAMSSLIQALALENWEVGKSIVYWTMGGLDRRTWQHVALIAPLFCIAFLCVMAFARELDILLAGETQAQSVGINVGRLRLALLALVAALDAAAVAVSGGIGFIGLVVPHIVRLVIGPSHKYLIPLSALTGAAVLSLADLMMRSVFFKDEIPVGIITASLGAPFFLWLLFKRRKQFF